MRKTPHSHRVICSPDRVLQGTSAQSRPLTFMEHSVPLLSPLGKLKVVPECLESHSPSLLSLSIGRESGMTEGKEESAIVPQLSWDVWTHAESQGQRKSTTSHVPESNWTSKWVCSQPQHLTGTSSVFQATVSLRVSVSHKHTGRGRHAFTYTCTHMYIHILRHTIALI